LNGPQLLATHGRRRAFSNLGQVLKAEGRYDDAEPLYRRAPATRERRSIGAKVLRIDNPWNR